MIFMSAWWSTDIPESWNAVSDKECSTFHNDPPIGILQISAARKEMGDVTDEDLSEFAEKREATRQLTKANLPNLIGFASAYQENGLSWREWWLRSGRLMLYVTYSVAASQEGVEWSTVLEILNSLDVLES